MRSFQKLYRGFFGDELLIWFGRLDCTLRKLGGFYVSFAVSENARLPLEKQPFVHQPTF